MTALYGRVFAVGLQNTLVYRWNFLLRAVTGFVPMLSTVFLWQNIFEQKPDFAGFTFSTMLAYYITLIILDSLASPTEDDFQIAADIKDGFLNQILLKPVNYLAYRFSLFTAARFIYTAVVALPIGIFVWCFRHHFACLPLDETWPWALLAVLGSAILQFMIAYTTALLAFWLLEIGSVVFIIYSFEYLIGGHVFPIDAFPEGIRQVALCTPFAYEYHFPVSVFLGRIQGADLWWGFAAQFFWIIFFILLSQWLWRRGIRKYTAVGG